MKTKRIYIKNWSRLKPYTNHSITDNYYLKLCNEVKQILYSEYSEILLYYIDEEGIDLLSCFLVSYFEDIISETNIFRAFTNKHQELYGKKLPFFDTSEYYDNEINQQDIEFLLWYFLTTYQEDVFINPLIPILEIIAEDVFSILDKEYEFAPENTLLNKFYSIPEDESDFYICRNIIDNVLYNSYLFYTDTRQALRDAENEIIEEEKDNENLFTYLRENRDTLLHSQHTKLLSLTGKEWIAEILGKKHRLYSDFNNISQKINSFFFYKGQDKENVFLEHIASAKKFKLTKKSFDNAHDLTDTDTIIFIGIVMWQNEWWFSGTFFIHDFDPDLILDEKNSIESRSLVNFLDYNRPEVKETLDQQYKVFLDFNSGKQLAFIPANKVETYTKEFVTFYNDSLNLSKKEIKKAKQRGKDEGFFGGNDTGSFEYDPDFESALVFFNPNSGLEIAFEINSAFPVNDNIYFDEEKSKEHILRLIMSNDISTELAMYCVSNYKKKLPFFNTPEGELLFNDLDFFLRFFKDDDYHTEPQVSFTGQTN